MEVEETDDFWTNIFSYKIDGNLHRLAIKFHVLLIFNDYVEEMGYEGKLDIWFDTKYWENFLREIAASLSEDRESKLEEIKNHILSTIIFDCDLQGI